MVKYHRNTIWFETNDVTSYSHHRKMGLTIQKKMYFEDEPNKLKLAEYETDHVNT
jgi:hypothetical protein